ncbi:restriction endonuclease subunit S [Ramlibacter sp. 2FC]|uniref:restriction endonuclease subunit S n=1 Tax=Ramlibacter sp. 2FC TaxID=2502188 RepID=UPI0010F4BD18|nr:restriction endonuclease subunit S [Ramlibacter sp. 2FC]
MSAPVRARVGDLAEQVRGVSYGKEDASRIPKEGYLPVLRAGNITDEGLVFDDLVYVPSARISQKQLVQKGDVVITASSGSLDVVGKAAPAPSSFNGGFGAFCKVLRPNAKVDASFFAHFFKTGDYRRKISSLAAGANINNLKNEHLDDLEIALPPLPEQRRIAAILDQAETLRTQRRAALAQLDGLAQSIFLDMFGDPVTNPKGWSIIRLDQLVRPDDTINYGVVQPGDALDVGIPLVRVGDVVDGNFDPKALKRIDPAIEAAYKRSRLKGDEVLVTCVGSIGVVALVDPAMKGFNIARAVARVPLSEKVNRTFVASYLRTDFVQRYFTAELRTVSQPTLNIKQICETQVIQPPLPLQQTFATRIQAIAALKASHRAALAGLDALFASLQQRAFAGLL